MEEFINQVLNHRSIRNFDGREVSEDTIEKIFEAVNRTATSCGLQQASIIRVCDKKIRREIADVCNQEYPFKAPELLIFIADSYRNVKFLEKNGEDISRESYIDMFFQGFIDAAIMAQNAVNIIESMDMGAVYFGGILNDSQKIIDCLNLPKLTFPVIALGFGYPKIIPEIKPRMDKRIRVFKDSYCLDDSRMDMLAEYNKLFSEYYKNRADNKKDSNFLELIKEKFESVNPTRIDMMKIVEDRGYKFNKY